MNNASKYSLALGLSLAFYACSSDTSSVSAVDATEENLSTSSTSTGTDVATSGTTTGVSSATVTEQSTEEAVVYEAGDGDWTLSFSASGLTVSNVTDGCVTVDGNLATVSCAGSYYLTGSSSDFEVLVDADTADKVYLYLNNLTLASASDAPLYVRSADKVFLMLIDGTENSLSDASTRSKSWSYTDDGEAKTDTTGAVIYAKKDITFKGNGLLTVTGNYKNGIHTTKDLKIKDVPTISVTAKNIAIKGKRSVEIEGGYLTLVSTGGDGIKSDEDDATKLANGKGYVLITGGEFNITAADDGIQASNYILIADSISTPSITVKTNSGKGIVADSSVTVNAGIVNVNAADDGIHSNGSVIFNGGATTISAGDDGVHADSALHVNGGTVNVETAYEGMEAWLMYFDGGVTSTYATDDGWNAAGGEALSGASTSSSFGGMGGFGGGMQSSSHGYIYITGGYHYVSASGNDIDVLDANGTATQTGGVLILEIPSSSGGSMGGMIGPGSRGGSTSSSGQCSTNQAGGLIDTDNGYTITGGVMLGFGSQTESYPSCTAMSYTNANYYGSANAAFKPQGSGSMILYGGEVTSVSTVDVSGMSSVEFPNGLVYYYK